SRRAVARRPARCGRPPAPARWAGAGRTRSGAVFRGAVAGGPRRSAPAPQQRDGSGTRPRRQDTSRRGRLGILTPPRNGAVMRAPTLLLSPVLLVTLGTPIARAQTPPQGAAWDSVARILQTPLSATGGYYRYNLPRRAVTLRIGDVTVSPSLALGAAAPGGGTARRTPHDRHRAGLPHARACRHGPRKRCAGRVRARLGGGDAARPYSGARDGVREPGERANGRRHAGGRDRRLR